MRDLRSGEETVLVNFGRDATCVYVRGGARGGATKRGHEEGALSVKERFQASGSGDA